MKQLILPATIILAIAATALSCHERRSPGTTTAAMDTAAITRGQHLFDANCSGCHNFRSDGIGPQLGGITSEVSDTWILHFIRHPQAAIDSGDDHALLLFRKYHAVMPPFAGLSNTQQHDLLSLLHSKKAPPPPPQRHDLQQVINPIPDSIAMSGIRLVIEPWLKMPASSAERPFTRINKIEWRGGAAYVLDMRGKLYQVINQQPQVYLDLATLEPKFVGQPGLATGFGSFTFDPEFEHNGLLYTTHTEPAHTQKADFETGDSIKSNVQWVLTEWKNATPTAPVFSGSHRELLRIDMVSFIHGMQEIGFRTGAKRGEKDFHQLYIGVGDGGCTENGYPSLAHNTSKVWGTVLRIDPSGHNSANGRYGIPADNPFARDSGKLHEIYAYGFRNPNRISWTSSRKMLVSNIGQANIESVNVVSKGNDFGWPMREGPFVMDPNGDMKSVYTLPKDDAAHRFSYPALQYDHDEGNSVSGGFEYNGNTIPVLKGKYIFGDIVSGRIFLADTKDLRPGNPSKIFECSVIAEGKKTTLRQLCGDHRVDLRFARDNHGELYIMTKADGMIYHLLAATSP